MIFLEKRGWLQATPLTSSRVGSLKNLAACRRDVEHGAELTVPSEPDVEPSANDHVRVGHCSAALHTKDSGARS